MKISEVITFIKNQVDEHMQRKGKDASVLSISVIIAKDAHKVLQAMLHVFINNPKTKK